MCSWRLKSFLYYSSLFFISQFCSLSWQSIKKTCCFPARGKESSKRLHASLDKTLRLFGLFSDTSKTLLHLHTHSHTHLEEPRRGQRARLPPTERPLSLGRADGLGGSLADVAAAVALQDGSESVDDDGAGGAAHPSGFPAHISQRERLPRLTQLTRPCTPPPSTPDAPWPMFGPTTRRGEKMKKMEKTLAQHQQREKMGKRTASREESECNSATQSQYHSGDTE